MTSKLSHFNYSLPFLKHQSRLLFFISFCYYFFPSVIYRDKRQRKEAYKCKKVIYTSIQNGENIQSHWIRVSKKLVRFCWMKCQMVSTVKALKAWDRADWLDVHHGYACKTRGCLLPQNYVLCLDLEWRLELNAKRFSISSIYTRVYTQPTQIHNPVYFCNYYYYYRLLTCVYINPRKELFLDLLLVYPINSADLPLEKEKKSRNKKASVQKCNNIKKWIQPVAPPIFWNLRQLFRLLLGYTHTRRHHTIKKTYIYKSLADTIVTSWGEQLRNEKK